MLALCGLDQGGDKAELQARLTEHLITARTQTFIRHLERPVLSIDIGFRNMAYCLVQPGGKRSKSKVLDWDRADLDVPSSYSPAEYSMSVRQFVDRLPREEAGVCLVERQRFLSSGISQIPLPILKSSVIEALLHALIPSTLSLTPDAVRSVLPRRVSQHFGLGAPRGSSLSISRRTAHKKREAVTLASALIALDGPVQCGAKYRRRFLAESKRDDMSDALLQALAWIEWQRWAIEEAKGEPHAPLLSSISAVVLETEEEEEEEKEEERAEPEEPLKTKVASKDKATMTAKTTKKVSTTRKKPTTTENKKIEATSKVGRKRSMKNASTDEAEEVIK